MADTPETIASYKLMMPFFEIPFLPCPRTSAEFLRDEAARVVCELHFGPTTECLDRYDGGGRKGKYDFSALRHSRRIQVKYARPKRPHGKSWVIGLQYTPRFS